MESSGRQSVVRFSLISVKVYKKLESIIASK